MTNVRENEPARQLARYAEYKPSGIGWLGDIPRHWSTKPLKNVANRSIAGITPPSGNEDYFQDGDIPWLGPPNLRSEPEVAAIQKFLNRSALRDGKARSVMGPALLVAIIGALGKAALFSGDVCSTNQQIVSFPLSNEVWPTFVIYQFREAES